MTTDGITTKSVDVHEGWTWPTTSLHLCTSKPRGACPSWPPIIEGKKPKILSTISWSLITSLFVGLLAKAFLLSLASASSLSRAARCSFKQRSWLGMTRTQFYWHEWLQGQNTIAKMLWQWGPVLLVQCWNVKSNFACAKQSQRPGTSAAGPCSYSCPVGLLIMMCNFSITLSTRGNTGKTQNS